MAWLGLRPRLHKRGWQGGGVVGHDCHGGQGQQVGVITTCKGTADEGAVR
jgi:hypothetical protein